MTQTQKPLIAFIDDEEDLAVSLAVQYSNDYETRAFTSPEEALRTIDESYAVVVADYRMAKITGIELLKRLRTKSPATIRVLLTAVPDLLPLPALINEAKVDYYIPKPPLFPDHMKVVLADAVDLYSLRQERQRNLATLKQDNAQLRAQLRVQTSGERSFEDLIGSDPQLQGAITLGRRAAKNIRPVLITGESGTGKEVLARAIHFGSSRAGGPFVAVNCGAISKDLFESEFFGHERGAFTGAIDGRVGHFEHANGGTLFLDEIGELPLPDQVKLLRALQEEEVLRVGSSKARKIDVRVISATSKDVDAEVHAERFRLDLFHRIDRTRIHLPPLRDRRDDVPMLVQHALMFESSMRGLGSVSITAPAVSYLQSFPYPGNVRELNNTIAKAMDNMEDAGETTIELEHVRSATELPKGAAAESGSLRDAVKAFKKHYIEGALSRHSTYSAAAKELDMSVKNLYLLIRALGLSTEK